MAETETAERPTGTLTMKFFGFDGQQEKIIWVSRAENEDADAILRRIVDVGKMGFRLPKGEGHRPYHRVECWWQYPGHEAHRQWCLTVD